ncbi:MAG: lactoylglutathione lyase [Alphaproteobacteria bacterium]|nr:lactoylglutathione lyase [Alphaproteobacteria bacterium]
MSLKQKRYLPVSFKGFQLEFRSFPGFSVTHEHDFTLVYLRNSEADVEVELTVNHGQAEPYSHGSGYGHLAAAVDNIDDEYVRFKSHGFESTDVKEFHRDGSLMAKFFFVQDPDGYKIEVLQNHGRYR